MVENEANQLLLSVHILLPEAVDRRLERWTKNMPGTSWPAWGGHITLVPNFTTRAAVDEVRAVLQSVCSEVETFIVRFGIPSAVQDTTRPEYYAVFLGVDAVEVEVAESATVSRLHILRERLLVALEPIREDMRPKLVEQPFLPHVTLALGVGEVEANQIVKAMRTDMPSAEFPVDVVWLVTQSVGENARFERYPVALGRVTPAELMRD